MASSGTLGLTVIDTTSVIEHAFRRCGKLASTVSSELQLSAKENLFLLLSTLASRGLSLWCVQKYVLGVTANQIVYPLDLGVVDVNSALYRTKTDLTGTAITGAGWRGLDLGATNTAPVNTVTLQFTAASAATTVIESSADLATWTPRAALSSGLPVAAGALICGDVDNSLVTRYWRVRDTSGTLAAVTALTLSTLPVEISMSKLSNDDYASLPNKTQAAALGSKALMYWYDKQITPQVWIFPPLAASGDQIVVWTQRHIQDVGGLSGTLNVPQRWLEAVILMLAQRCAMELPAGELPEGRYELLKNEANEAMLTAEDGESDGSPIRIAPRIRGYTR